MNYISIFEVDISTFKTHSTSFISLYHVLKVSMVKINTEHYVTSMLNLFLVSIFILPAVVDAECINACSGHGECSIREMCRCYPRWMGGDCSQSKFFCFVS